MRRYLSISLIMALLIGSMVGGAHVVISSTHVSGGQGKVVVAVTLAPLAWVVKFIGGPYVSVYSVIPPGVDPHSYEPPASTLIKELSRAKLIVMTGPSHLPIEREIRELVNEGLINAKLICYTDYVANGLKLLKNPLTGKLNPHGYMFSLNGLKSIAKAVANALSLIDASHARYYISRERECIEMLDSELKGLKAVTPAGVKVGLTAPPLQYIARELGLNVTFMLLPDVSSKVTVNEVELLRRLTELGRVNVILISDFMAKERPRILSLYRSMNLTYVIVPVRGLSYEPALIPAVLTGELRAAVFSHGMRRHHGVIAYTGNILTPIMIAEAFIIALLLALLLKYRRVVKDAVIK